MGIHSAGVYPHQKSLGIRRITVYCLISNTASSRLGKLDARILDIACGTGLVMIELKKFADYHNADGLDPSEGMAEVAKEKGCYRNVHIQYFDNESGLEQDTYDIVMCSAAMAPAHVKSEAVKEMYCLIKPGGYIILTVRSCYMETDPDLHQLRPLINQLCEEGKLELVEEVPFNYDDMDVSGGSAGIQFILKKLI